MNALTAIDQLAAIKEIAELTLKASQKAADLLVKQKEQLPTEVYKLLLDGYKKNTDSYIQIMEAARQIKQGA